MFDATQCSQLVNMLCFSRPWSNHRPTGILRYLFPKYFLGPYGIQDFLSDALSQIVSLQALHYLTLSLLIPPLLHLFADPVALNYEGGASNVGMKL